MCGPSTRRVAVGQAARQAAMQRDRGPFQESTTV